MKCAIYTTPFNSVNLDDILQIFQTAILLLRIDDIVSGTKKSEGKEGTQSGAQPTDASMAD